MTAITRHERPGVYSSYDASSVVQRFGGGKVVGLAALWCLTLLFRPEDNRARHSHA